MKRLLVNKDKYYIIQDETKDFHCNEGMIKSDDIKKSKPGSILKTNKGIIYNVLESSFLDEYKKLKRGAQIIPRKDIGLIITETGITKDSIVIETGAGSGGLGCLLAKIVKKIHSYEIREDFAKVAKANRDRLGITNYKINLQDSKLGFKEKNVDVIVLDLPDPWELIQVSKKALKIGGFIVSYSPTIPQVMDFVSNLDQDYKFIKTIEVAEKEWEVKGRKVRPKSQSIGHSGFLTFARRMK
jgi:tRNA (adenine57-N1/adenine58-N1)-methyltransferase catalytic subunit